MNITFSLELSNKASSNEENSLFIRCTQDRKHKRIALGIGIKKQFWDKKNKRVKSAHQLSVELNNLITEKLKKITKAYAHLLQENDEVSMDDLVIVSNTSPTSNFFEFAYRTKLAEIKFRKKMGTYRRYDAVLNKLKAYAGANLNTKKINYSFLREYEIYLRTQLNNGQDTVSANMSVIRSIINEAIRHGIYTERNPFDQMKLKYTDNTKEKLTAAELNSILVTKLPSIPSLLLARDFFISCFLAEGTRGGDMVAMMHDNIINNCLVFHQQKTGKQMVIPINGHLQEIITKYSDRGNYLFPLLNEEKVVNEAVINSKLTYINKYLKELSKYCGILKKLTTHVARHTYTDLALQVSNGNIYQVQQSLGHSSVKTTEIYSRNRVNYQKTSLLPDIMLLINNQFKV